MTFNLYADIETGLADDNPSMIQKVDQVPKPKAKPKVINHDLFDDVLEPMYTPQTTVQESTVNQARHAFKNESKDNGKRVLCWVGNLTWWTTDTDIETAIESIGVTDMKDIHIEAYPHNGQSKGFACVAFGSEESIDQIVKQLPRLTINTRHPEVRTIAQGGKNYFDMKTKRIKPTDNTAANPVINMFNHLPNPAASFAQMGFTGMIPPPGVAGMPVPPPGLPPHLLSALKDKNPASFSLRDFESLMDKNREITSNAISKAKDYCDQRDYDDAVVALQSAIQIIKMTPIAKDDRSQVLISSLEDMIKEVQDDKSNYIRKKEKKRRKREAQAMERDDDDYRREKRKSRDRDERRRDRRR